MDNFFQFYVEQILWTNSPLICNPLRVVYFLFKVDFFHLKRKTNISRKSHGLLVLAYHYKRSKTKEGEMLEQAFSCKLLAGYK